MTTNEKLESYQRKSGRTWIDIASILGVSRQMLNAVRTGERKLSQEKEKKIDAVLSEMPHTIIVPAEAPTTMERENAFLREEVKHKDVEILNLKLQLNAAKGRIAELTKGK